MFFCPRMTRISANELLADENAEATARPSGRNQKGTANERK